MRRRRARRGHFLELERQEPAQVPPARPGGPVARVRDFDGTGCSWSLSANASRGTPPAPGRGRIVRGFIGRFAYKTARGRLFFELRQDLPERGGNTARL